MVVLSDFASHTLNPKTKASYNNTKITITNNEGRTINWSSCGKVGFKGAKRSTSFAAQTCGQRCAEDSVEKGVPSVRVLLKG